MSHLVTNMVVSQASCVETRHPGMQHSDTGWMATFFVQNPDGTLGFLKSFKLFLHLEIGNLTKNHMNPGPRLHMNAKAQNAFESQGLKLI